MKFMMLMIPKVYQPGSNSGAAFTPPAEEIEKMMRYNEELAKSGALVSLDGLHPPESAAKVTFSSGGATVTDGPFSETHEVLGGYWVIDVASRDEAIAWARRVPAADGDMIEVRQIFTTEDWPDDAREAAKSEIVDEALASRENARR